MPRAPVFRRSRDRPRGSQSTPPLRKRRHARAPTVSSARCNRASMVSSCRSTCGADSKRLIGGMRRQRGHRTPLRRHEIGFGARDFVCGNRVSAAMRSSTRVTGALVRDRASDRAAALPAIAAAQPAAPLPSASAASAPCRNRPARLRECLRDCRHKAQATDRAQGFHPCCSARSSSTARTIWRSFARMLRSLRGSISRATCMVMVEPPDTISRCRSQSQPARNRASGSTP